MRLYTLLFVILLSLPAAAERLVIISTPQSGRATVSVVDTPGVQPRTVARLNRGYRYAPGIAPGAGKPMNGLGTDTVLLSFAHHAITVGLTSGVVTELQPLFRGREYQRAPLYRVAGKLTAPSYDVAISSDRRYAVIPACRNGREDTPNAFSHDVVFALYDSRSDTFLWAEPERRLVTRNPFNPARFTAQGVLLFRGDTAYLRGYRRDAVARPVASAAGCAGMDARSTWAILTDSAGASPRLFNLTTLRNRSDIVIPEGAHQFDFTSDGRWLTYHLPAGDTGNRTSGVEQVNLLTGAVDRFARRHTHNVLPAYSPNGSYLCWLEIPDTAPGDSPWRAPRRLAVRHNRRTQFVELPLLTGDIVGISKVTNQAVWLEVIPYESHGRSEPTNRYYRVPWTTRTPELWYEHPGMPVRDYEVFVP